MSAGSSARSTMCLTMRRAAVRAVEIWQRATATTRERFLPVNRTLEDAIAAAKRGERG
jgi:hypothetical protein